MISTTTLSSCLVEGEDVFARLGGQQFCLFQGPARQVAAALEAALAAGVLDQDTAHRLGGGGEEVAAAVPVPALGVANQAQVSLVYEGGRLERLPGRFVGEAMGGQAAQVVVDQLQELPGGMGVAGLQSAEHHGDVGHGQSPAKCPARFPPS